LDAGNFADLRLADAGLDRFRDEPDLCLWRYRALVAADSVVYFVHPDYSAGAVLSSGGSGQSAAGDWLPLRSQSQIFDGSFIFPGLSFLDWSGTGDGQGAGGSGPGTDWKNGYSGSGSFPHPNLDLHDNGGISGDCPD